MKTIDTLNGHLCSVKVYDSVADLVAEIRQRVAESSALSDRLDYFATLTKFIGRDFADGQECLNAIDENWEYGLTILEDMLRELSTARIPEPVSRVRRTRFNEDGGDEICIDRLRAGQPEFWRDSFKTPTVGQQVITINAAIGCLANVDANDVLWRGAAAVAVAKILESAGYSVELWATSHSEDVDSGDAPDCMTAIKLKGAGDALNESSLVNACSAWFFRTAVFASRYLTPVARPGQLQAVGSTISQKISMGFKKHITSDPDTLTIDDCFTFADAVNVARNYLEQLAEKAI